MIKTYRTFEDRYDQWRWDGKKMESFHGHSWEPSCYANPEELLEEVFDVTETTPKP